MDDFLGNFANLGHSKKKSFAHIARPFFSPITWQKLVTMGKKMLSEIIVAFGYNYMHCAYVCVAVLVMIIHTFLPK
jgi:hypothetical protein